MRKKVRPEILLQIQQTQDYGARLQLFKSECSLISYCTEYMPDGMGISGQLPRLPFSLNLVKDTVDKFELITFEAYLREEIRTFGDELLRRIPFERKLLMCFERMGHIEKYQVCFSNGSIGFIGLTPLGRYEVEAFNNFYLSQYRKAHTAYKNNGFSLIISCEQRKQRFIENLFAQGNKTKFIELELKLVYAQLRSNSKVEELVAAQLEDRSDPPHVSAWDAGHFAAMAVAGELADYIRFLKMPSNELYNLCEQVAERRELAERISRQPDLENKLHLFTSRYEILLSGNFLFPGGDEKSLGPAFYRYNERPPMYEEELEEKNIYRAYLEREVRTLHIIIEAIDDPIKRLNMLSKYFGKELSGRFEFDSGAVHICFHARNRAEIRLYNEYLTEKLRSEIYKKAIPMVYQFISFDERRERFEYLLSDGNVSPAELVASECIRAQDDARRHGHVWEIVQRIQKDQFDLCAFQWSQDHCASYIFATDIVDYLNYLSRIRI